MIRISWPYYHTLVRDLDWKIHEAVPAEGTIYLVGIPRGGMLAALLLTYLDPRYEIIGEAVGYRHLVKEGSVFLIDDVLETGKTRDHWIPAVAPSIGFRPQLAVLVDKSSCYSGVDKADLAAISLGNKEWVLFPYEVEEAEEKRSKIP